MRLQILSQAIQDIRNGELFYEEQEAGIGTYFSSSIIADIESLLLYYRIHKAYMNYHIMYSKRFPYGIYYKIADNKIQVYRVLDCRQNPSKIRKALDS